MATDHNFRIKNGLEVGGQLIVNSSGQLVVADITANQKFHDNVQLQFGTGTDSNIRHDGSNTKFTHTGSGGLYIGADTFGIQNGSHNENFIMAAANGAVTVYYDGALRLSTTSTGIKVEGPHGEGTFSAQNTSGFHIYTDRDRFYFNKRTSHISNNITSYSGDFNLQRQDSTKLTLTSTGASVTGNLDVSGDLNITGDINSVSVTDLDVVDKTITLGVGGTAANNDGGGVIINGANAEFIWDNTNAQMTLNKDLKFTANEKLRFGNTYFNKSGDSNNVHFYAPAGFIPHSTTVGNNANLGAPSYRWNGVYSSTGDFSSTITINQGGSFSKLDIKTSRTGATQNIGGVQFYDSSNAQKSQLYGTNDGQLKLATNGATVALTLDASQNATFAGTISSGTITATSNTNQLRLMRTDDVGDDWRFYSWTDGLNIFPADEASTVWFGRDGGTTDVSVYNGTLKIGTTTVIDSSRNLTNIGTISSARLIVNSGANVSQFHSHHTTGHDDWQVSPISIRERGLNSNNSTNNQYSPNLNFHWASVVSRSLTMTSDGNFTLGEWTASGTPEMSGNLSFLNTAGYRVNNTNVIDSSRNLTNIGTISSGAITSTGNITTSQHIQLGSGYNLSWGGTYGANKPTIAGAGGFIAFYPTGATDGEVIRIDADGIDMNSHNLTEVGTINSGAITATNISVGNSAGNTRSVIDTNATYYSYYNTETSPRIQLGRDVGISGGAGLALGGNSSYALIGTNNTSGSAMYFKTASAVATVTTNPDMTLNSSGNLTVRGTITSTGTSTFGVVTSSSYKVGASTVIDNSRNLLNIGSGNFAGDVTLSGGSGKLIYTGMGTLLHADTTFSNVPQHDLLYWGWTSATSDYIYLKAGGNSTGGHGTLVVADGGLFYGVWDNETGAIASSSTNPITTTRFRVDNSGNGTFAGTISSGAITASNITSTSSSGSASIYINSTRPTLGFTDSNSFSDSNDIYLIRGTSGDKLQFQFFDNSAGSTTETFNIDNSGNATFAGTISSGTITSSGKLQLNDGADIQWAGGYGSNKPLIAANANVLNFYTHGASGGVEFALTGSAVDFKNNPATNVGTISSGVLSVNSGTANIAATFQSTDGIAGIKLQDSSGNVELSASGSTFRVQPSGGTPVLEINSSGNATFSGNIVAEDSEVHVGNSIGGDSWTRIKHAQADGYGFDWQHDNASVIVNEQGSTNQVLVLGDVDAGNYSGLLGVAHSTNSGTGWTKKLDLKGNGELYIGASGTSHVYHEGHKPTYTELGTMAYSNLTGTPTIPSLSGYATESYVGTQISNLVDSSPAALNTLNELAAAIGDDANFSTTVTNNIASKVSKSGDTITSGTNVGLTINHNTFGAGLRLHRNHASNASSIQFINNGGRQGTLLGIASDNGLYWQIGTSSTNNKIFHDTYHPNADTLTTARTIAGTSFNGSANIDISYDNLTNKPTSIANSDTVDSLHASQFLRSDANDTATGTITFNSTPVLTGTSSNEGGELNFGAPTGGVYSSFALDNYQGHFRVHTLASGKEFRIHSASSGLTTIGSNLGTVWGANNDGSGSGLDADLLDGTHKSGFFVQSGSWLGDLGNNGYTRENGLSMTGGSEFVVLSKGGQGSVLIDGAYISYEGSNGFFGSYNSSYGNASGIRATAASTVTVQKLNGNNANLAVTGNITRSGNTVWDAGNDGSGTGLDADLLDGRHLQQVARYQSGSDFANGTLVTTDISSSGTNGDSFVIEITGKAYGSSRPHSVIAEGYLYNNTIINTNGTNISGSNFTYLKVMNNSGYLSFWWPRHGYWNSYDVHVRSSSGGTANYNRVTAIANSVDPSGATKKIQINLTTSWNASNDGSGSGLDADLLDGQQGSYYAAASSIPTNNNQLTNGAGYITDGNTNWNNSYGFITASDSSITSKLPLAGGIVTGSITVRDNITVGNYSTTDTGSLLLTGSTANKQAVLKCTNGNLHMDGNSGNAMYLNYYTGSGIYFGTGAGGVAAVMGPDGDLWKGSGDNSGSKYWHAGNDGSGSSLDADLLDGQHGTYYNQTLYNSTGNAAGSYLGGHYSSGGTEKPNSGTFGAGKLKIAMLGSSNLGFGGAWNDVLWTSSYNGSDVKKSTALVSSKYDNTSLWVVKQNYDSSSWGTGYLFWNTGNDGSGSGLDADLLDGLNLHTGRNNEANKVVRTDVSGYIQAGWINTTSGSTTGTNRIYASNDGYIRYVTPATFISNLGLFTTSNDGSGSGLDADLLDGIQASGFLQAGGGWGASNMPGSRYVGLAVNGGEVAFLRDNPNNAQMSVLADGAFYAGENNGFYSLYSGNSYNSKSGFHADTSGILQFNGQTYAQFNTQHGNIKLGPMNSSYAHIYTDTVGGFYFNKGALYANGNAMWHAGNDGSGSTLDADTVDGIQGAAIVKGGTARKSSQVTSFAGVNEVCGFYFGNNVSGAPTTDWINYIHSAGNSWSSSNNYSFQLTHAFHSDSLWVSRTTNGSQSTARRIWDSASDGSGSGLDADTLDGTQRSEFLYDLSTGDFRHNPGGSAGNLYLGHVPTTNVGSAYIVCQKQTNAGQPGSILYYISPTGTTNGSTAKFKMESDGDFHADGNVIAYSTTTGSDRKLKKNIRDLEGSLDKTLKLRGVKYDWKDENKDNNQLGFIAQEVEEVLPEVVKEVETLGKDSTHLTVNYPAVVPLLVEAIKEQQTLINRLEERIKDLENKQEK